MSSEPPAAPVWQRYSLNGETMGSRYTAVFYAAAGIDVENIDAKLFAAVDRVDRQMSTWKPASDLCRLNDAAEHIPIAVPTELAFVLDTAMQVCGQSKGAFDIGVGDLVAAWGFGPTQRASSLELSALRETTHHTIVNGDLKLIQWGCGQNLGLFGNSPCIHTKSAFGQ